MLSEATSSEDLDDNLAGPNGLLIIRLENRGRPIQISEAIRAWAPAYENYTFTATPQGTKLTVEQDITEDFESMEEAWPMALEKLKALCEDRAR
jgi:hypothetical protein